ncbi:metal resistance protein YCF1 [Schizosaccharomyces japonicus yFS275]|uniref:Metal resistance protein YCF1 n=1 Tax=Schizosaccharomyces japonicus (strain yFS275 / FY16936) TaxID=402676 RepID=B6K0F0_SCHJY|nr:metal resistance protein YCF1 [Schizosaccharomyces japonicus yFS275]EEB06300.1 metal resistance protein YCF1 [Schizosaccharomyces japonicus yFS275]
MVTPGVFSTESVLNVRIGEEIFFRQFNLFPSYILLLFGGFQYFLDLRKRDLGIRFKSYWTIWLKLLNIVLLITLGASSFVDVFGWYGTIVAFAALAFAAFIHVVEQPTLRVPFGSLLMFYALSLISTSTSFIFHKSKAFSSISPSTFGLWTIFSVIGLTAELFVPPPNRVWLPADEAATNLSGLRPAQYTYANIFSKITFSWLTPIMRFGYKHYLKEEDCWELPKVEQTDVQLRTFSKYWNRYGEKVGSQSGSLWLVLFRAHFPVVALCVFYKFIQDCLAFVQPQLIRRIIIFVNSYTSKHPFPASNGILLSLGMLVSSAVQSAIFHQYLQLTMIIGMRWRAQLIAAIYRKALRLSSETRQGRSTGDIVNYMAVDTQKLADLTMYLFISISGPFQIVLALVSLYKLLGYSALSGVVIMLLLIPMNAVIASYAKKLQAKQMKNKDARSRMMTEIINNIKSIKLYSWEKTFYDKLINLRNNKELRMLRKIFLVNCGSFFLWLAAPIFVSFVTFGTFILIYGKSRPLTTDIVFSALALFNLLQFPLAMLPNVISSILEASVAVRRIHEYLIAPELAEDAIERHAVQESPEGVIVEVKDATFYWNDPNSEGAAPILKDINFIARKGELSCIVGRVGMGKSSLLEAILGDMHRAAGTVKLYGNIAYAAQQPWILNATVRENILFGHDFEPEFYEKTIDACSLRRDFEMFADGDQTEVGEKGISLSGGQKARISLARAVYSRADLYILDDVLSAVDQHVSKHLIDNILGPKGLLRSRAVILATNSLPVLQVADSIHMLRDGQVVEHGSFTQLSADENSQLFQLLKEFGTAHSESTSLQESTTLEEDKESDAMEASVGTTERRNSTITIGKPVISQNGRIRRKVVDEEDTRVTGVKRELQNRGHIRKEVYFAYFKSASLVATVAYFICIVAGMGMNVASNVWLKHWSEVNTGADSNPSAPFYLFVYFGLGLAFCFLIAVANVILTVYGTLRASHHLHDSMLKAVLRAPMSFFETTPTGRILNRFSSDVYRIDEVIARVFMFFFRNATQVTFVLLVIIYSSPGFLLLVLPLGILYRLSQRYYTHTSRELKRLDSVTRSPLYAHFQESLGGLSTIRAYDRTGTFVHENDWRVDTNHRIFYLFFTSNRWLAVRLEFIGSCVVFSSAFLGVLSALRGHPNAGLVGLSLSYAIQITQNMSFIVRQMVDVETNIVSVERILEYSNIKSEAPAIIPDRRPPTDWPSKGAVDFNHYSVRYRENLPLVLQDINISVKPQEKIGIVGRTGAGKSTLTMALFRMIEPTKGNISIDGLNTSTIGLEDLRSHIAIIPQENQAFEGTLRDNLDPAGHHTDEDIYAALEDASLSSFVKGLPEGLYFHVTEGGSNLSLGQRQLLCLTRALLTPTKVLLLDEATAAVDVETDAIVQATIRSKFHDRTIMTIAHRINTVLDSDRILVLDHGQVVEFDNTQKLLNDKNSLFYSLVYGTQLA